MANEKNLKFLWLRPSRNGKFQLFSAAFFLPPTKPTKNMYVYVVHKSQQKSTQFQGALHVFESLQIQFSL